LIKKVFDENGVEFAYPTVKVAEGTDHKIAAVQQVVEKVKADAAPPAGSS
jgi:hypothetical protein